MTKYHQQILNDDEMHRLQALAAHKLSSQERTALDAMWQENTLSVLEEIFECLKNNTPTAFIQPAPSEYSDLNQTIRDLISDFRGE